MKKLMIFGLLISLFAFWGSKNEVNTVHAEEVAQETGTSATFAAGVCRSKLGSYGINIVSLTVANNTFDINSIESDTEHFLDKFAIGGCEYTDASGVTTTPAEGVIFAYISKADGYTTETPRYDCVLYANVDNIYANPDASDMFFGFQKLETLDIKILDTSKATDMNGMFYNCLSLTTLDLSNFDTTNVTDMSDMFYQCSSLTELVLSNKFNTSNVTNMYWMFNDCRSLTKLDLSSFNTSNVTNMNSMFHSCSSLTTINVSSFDTSSVEDMGYMFCWCSSLTEIDISNFNTSNIMYMNSMFDNCRSLSAIDLSNIDTSNDKDIGGIIRDCKRLRYIKSPTMICWDDQIIELPQQFTTYLGVSEINSTNFSQYPELSLLPEIGTSAMFSTNPLFIILRTYFHNIVKITVSNNVADLPLESKRVCDPIVIEGCTYTDASGVTTTPAEGVIFAYISNAIGSTDTNKRYDCVLYADVEKIYAHQNSTELFSGFSSLENIDIKVLDTSKTTNMNGLFSGCCNLNSIDVDNMDTSSVLDMSYMFEGCSSLVKLNLSNFDTRNAENMSHMFEGCSSLTELNVSSFITTNVTNMAYMFCGCSSLTELNVSNFNTSKVTNMVQMFRNCSSLKNINLSNFDTSKVTGMDRMFMECSSLIELNLYNFNTSNVVSVLHMFNSCTSLKSINLSSFDLSNAMDLKDCIRNCPKLEYIKSPKALPAKSATVASYTIELPTQFSPYSDITALTADNLADHKVLNLPGDKFVYEWKNLRIEGGDNGICNAIPSTSTGNAKLTQLLNDYDNFDTETKEYVNKATDKENVTVGESVAYVKNVLNGTQTTEKDYGVSKEDSGSYITMSITEESPYLIITISLLGILAVLGYYFYNKKKQAM